MGYDEIYVFPGSDQAPEAPGAHGTVADLLVPVVGFNIDGLSAAAHTAGGGKPSPLRNDILSLL